MDMVRQYMKDEEVRLQHQSSLLRLRQKALKDKTRMELAWLEHQRKRLRDKGEDDKMPPIRKKQRGLLLKLQQEQVLGHSKGHLSFFCHTVTCFQQTNVLFHSANFLRLRLNDFKRPTNQRGRKGSCC